MHVQSKVSQHAHSIDRKTEAPGRPNPSMHVQVSGVVSHHDRGRISADHIEAIHDLKKALTLCRVLIGPV